MTHPPNAQPADAARVEPADAFLLNALAQWLYQDEVREIDGVSAGTSEIIARLRALAGEVEQRELRTHTRWVRVADQLVEQLSNEWSAPVRVKVTADDGRELQLVFQRDYPNPT